MKRIDFNQGWSYYRVGETEKKQVTLPHDAMISEKRTADSAGGINTGWFEGYDYVYEKTFDVPKAYEGVDVSFEFEGVYHNAEVYLNGKKAAFRPYGYTNFYVPASEYLKYGEKNEIRVIAHNADQPNSRWYSGAGIYRPVWMYVAPRQHIEQNGVRVRTLSIAPVAVEVEVRTSGAGKLTLSVYKKDRVKVCNAASEEEKAEMKKRRQTEEQEPVAVKKVITEGKATVRFEIPNAKLWETGSPELYTLEAVFCGAGCAEQESDREEVAFGIRTVAWDRKKGFSVNGKRVIIRGACIHHDNGVLGACCYPEAEERKIRILKENGYNAVRSAHNPCSKAMLEACDRLGMMVMDEFVVRS